METFYNKDEVITEKPFPDEKGIKRLDGFGADKSDLTRGYIEPFVPKPAYGRWAPKQYDNDVVFDLEADDRPRLIGIIL